MNIEDIDLKLPEDISLIQQLLDASPHEFTVNHNLSQIKQLVKQGKETPSSSQRLINFFMLCASNCNQVQDPRAFRNSVIKSLNTLRKTYQRGKKHYETRLLANAWKRLLDNRYCLRPNVSTSSNFFSKRKRTVQTAHAASFFKETDLVQTRLRTSVSNSKTFYSMEPCAEEIVNDNNKLKAKAFHGLIVMLRKKREKQLDKQKELEDIKKAQAFFNVSLTVKSVFCWKQYLNTRQLDKQRAHQITQKSQNNLIRQHFQTLLDVVAISKIQQILETKARQLRRKQQKLSFFKAFKKCCAIKTVHPGFNNYYSALLLKFFAENYAYRKLDYCSPCESLQIRTRVGRASLANQMRHLDRHLLSRCFQEFKRVREASKCIARLYKKDIIQRSIKIFFKNSLEALDRRQTNSNNLPKIRNLLKRSVLSNMIQNQKELSQIRSAYEGGIQALKTQLFKCHCPKLVERLAQLTCKSIDESSNQSRLEQFIERSRSIRFFKELKLLQKVNIEYRASILKAQAHYELKCLNKAFQSLFQALRFKQERQHIQEVACRDYQARLIFKVFKGWGQAIDSMKLLQKKQVLLQQRQLSRVYKHLSNNLMQGKQRKNLVKTLNQKIKARFFTRLQNFYERQQHLWQKLTSMCLKYRELDTLSINYRTTRLAEHRNKSLKVQALQRLWKNMKTKEAQKELVEVKRYSLGVELLQKLISQATKDPFTKVTELLREAYGKRFLANISQNIRENLAESQSIQQIKNRRKMLYSWKIFNNTLIQTNRELSAKTQDLASKLTLLRAATFLETLKDQTDRAKLLKKNYSQLLRIAHKHQTPKSTKTNPKISNPNKPPQRLFRTILGAKTLNN